MVEYFIILIGLLELKVLNIDKAKKEIKWTIDNKMHSLEDGLTKTIEFYKKEYLR